MDISNPTPLNPDHTEAFENMQNYCYEKLGLTSPHSLAYKPTLSSWVQLALNEVPASGALMLERIESAKTQISSKKRHEQHEMIEGLWHEIHSQLSS